MRIQILKGADKGFLDFPYTVLLTDGRGCPFGKVIGVANTRWGARRLAKRHLKKRPESWPNLVEELS